MCLYGLHTSSAPMIIALYVKNLLTASYPETVLVEAEGLLGRRFEMEDQGKSGTLLGMDTSGMLKKGALHLSQRSYALRVVKRFGLKDAKENHTSMNLNVS